MHLQSRAFTMSAHSFSFACVMSVLSGCKAGIVTRKYRRMVGRHNPMPINRLGHAMPAHCVWTVSDGQLSTGATCRPRIQQPRAERPDRRAARGESAHPLPGRRSLSSPRQAERNGRSPMKRSFLVHEHTRWDLPPRMVPFVSRDGSTWSAVPDRFIPQAARRRRFRTKQRNLLARR